MNRNLKYFGNIDLNKNVISNVVIQSTNYNTSNLSNVRINELFFKDGDTSNLYTYNGSAIVKIGSKLSISELSKPTGNLDLGNVKIINVSYPTSNNDVATKKYVLDRLLDGNFDLSNSIVSFSNVYAIDNTSSHKINMEIIDDAIFNSISKPPIIDESNVTNNKVTYTAKLPRDLISTKWYIEKDAGGIIDNYISSSSTIKGTFNFLSGVYKKTGTYSNLSLTLNNTLQSNTISILNDTYRLYTDPKTSANITVNSTEPFNSYWANTEVSVNLQFLNDGGHRLLFGYDKYNKSKELVYYYDSLAYPPRFQSNVTAVLDEAQYKYLSNIAHYGLNSVFQYSFVANSGIFTRAYHPTEVADRKSVV